MFPHLRGDGGDGVPGQLRQTLKGWSIFLFTAVRKKDWQAPKICTFMNVQKAN